MRGTRATAVIVRHLPTSSAAARVRSSGRRLHIVARPSRHRLDALEVDDEVDRTDDERQRCHHDERQYGGRLEYRLPAWRGRGRRQGRV